MLNESSDPRGSVLSRADRPSNTGSGERSPPPPVPTDPTARRIPRAGSVPRRATFEHGPRRARRGEAGEPPPLAPKEFPRLARQCDAPSRPPVAYRERGAFPAASSRTAPTHTSLGTTVRSANDSLLGRAARGPQRAHGRFLPPRESASRPTDVSRTGERSPAPLPCAGRPFRARPRRPVRPRGPLRGRCGRRARRRPPGAPSAPLAGFPAAPGTHLSRNQPAGTIRGLRTPPAGEASPAAPRRRRAPFPRGYLVDPASNIRLSQRLSHACLSTHGRYSETANGSLNQLWFL